MREIKFRAWFNHGNTKEMLYDEMPGDCLVWKNQGQAIESVMQYTGLVDKNGREIYEGDIDKHSKAQIVFLLEEGGYCLTRFDEKGRVSSRTRLNRDNEKYIEVIGNIYENPELLEGMK